MSATGWKALSEAHPHHVTLIESCTGMSLPGTLVRLVDGWDAGTFYTGLRDGDRALVTSMGYGTDSRTLARVDDNGARLASQIDRSVPVLEGDWTVEEIRAGQRAAQRYAQELLERAYTSANRLLGAPGTDTAAVSALRDAKTARDFAFALGIWAEYERTA